MTNRLSKETSPYLLAHADNPVDWYTWGDEAFAAAQSSNRPILLSVGYSACHWCHVMAHESFEDEATAELMNRLYVNIKIDREERPDIDKIYQLAHQLITQRGGGWPLTMFLNPDDQRPFFGGTYFPNEPRYGVPAFSELLTSVAHYYAEKKDEVLARGAQLHDILQRLEPPAADAAQQLHSGPLAKAREQLEQTFDKDYGGFGSAPKFPHPSTIERLLRHWRSTADSAEPDLHALFMATLTLTRMADGGIHDHLAGGFCRYSVDRYWQIPHFEKMLYDNGPLLALYAQAWLASGDTRYADVASSMAEWMIRDMQSPEGGFYAALDADSEGEEGRYYVWTPEQVQTLLDTDDYAAFSRHYGLDRKANFEGRWHLCVCESTQDTALATQQNEHELREMLQRCKARLLAAREQRTPPARDDKQLTAWMALAIRGLAIAGRALDRTDFTDAAARAVDFIRRDLLVDGRLRANYMDRHARLAAYLDDYAFLLDALLELLQARWSTDHMTFACQLADSLLEHFEDKSGGGFFFTADDQEQLLYRPKPLADEAMPSGNGIAASALLRLGFLLGNSAYLAAAERTLKAAWKPMDEYGSGHMALLNALQDYLQPPEIIVIRGEPGEIQRWSGTAAKLYTPSRMVFAIPADTGDLPGLLAERKAQSGETIAYRCQGTQCDLPVSGWNAFVNMLKSQPAP